MGVVTDGGRADIATCAAVRDRRHHPGPPDGGDDVREADADRPLAYDGAASTRACWRLSIGRSGTAVIVTVAGRLDGVAAADLDHILRDLICDQGNLHVAIDVGGLGDVDADGVAALVDARQLAGEHGATLVLLRTPPAIERALSQWHDGRATEEQWRPSCSRSSAGAHGGGRSRVWAGPEPDTRMRPTASVAEKSSSQAGDHLIELYGSNGDLAESVRDFLLPAVVGGQAALVVATADHRRRFDDELRAVGVDVDDCRQRGQYVSLDASGMLARFMVDDRPDAHRFETVVGELVRRLSASFGGVRIYGEMVAVLWADGNVGAAMALEDLWNDLRASETFDLLCAYSSSLFARDDAIELFQRVCDQHTGVVPRQKVSGEEDARRAIARLEQRLDAVSTARDALAERNQRLDEALARMEAVQRVRNELLATAVHDIRTPTVALSGFLTILRESWASLDADRIDLFLSRGLDNLRQVGRLVEDMLTAAYLESGHFAFNFGPVDMGDVVDRAAVTVGSATGAEIDVRVPSRLPRAWADDTRQVQILTNLLTNAVKFSPAGTPVVVTVEARADELLVSVADAGSGIGSEEPDALFRPFAQGSRPEQRQATATGLGLYIARSLVEGQGGSISVRDNRNAGCTFSFTVPTVDRRTS